MTHILMPLELMTAEERAGYRIACERMRLHGARIEVSGKAVAGENPRFVQDGALLAHCGKMIQVVADLTEDMLKYTPGADIPTLAPEGG